MQSLKIDYLQGFCIIELTISQSGPDRDFFSFARSRSSSRATFLCARKVAAGSRVFLTGRAASSSCSPPLDAGAAAATRLVAGAATMPARLSRWSPSRVL